MPKSERVHNYSLSTVQWGYYIQTKTNSLVRLYRGHKRSKGKTYRTYRARLKVSLYRSVRPNDTHRRKTLSQHDSTIRLVHGCKLAWGTCVKSKTMRKIKYIDNLNGQFEAPQTNQRYKSRELYEDRVKHEPTKKEKKVYTLIHNHSGSVRRRGKWDKARVLREYPCSLAYEHREVDTDRVVYKSSVVSVRPGNYVPNR